MGCQIFRNENTAQCTCKLKKEKEAFKPFDNTTRRLIFIL